MTQDFYSESLKNNKKMLEIFSKTLSKWTFDASKLTGDLPVFAGA